MMKDSLLLLRTLLLSTSGRNIYRHSKDKKKKRRIIAGAIGSLILYAMLMLYSIALCAGYASYGLIQALPVMCALMISALSFFFTFFKTNGYLFGFREYDMLLSLPFEVRTVAGCKFLYMYVKSLPWYLSISLAMMIGYGYFVRPSLFIYPLWLLLSLFLPVIPMLIAAFLGFLIARVSAGFKKTNIIQTVITFVFVIFCFSLRFIIEDVVKNEKVEETLQMTAQISKQAGETYPPALWFSEAITKHRLSDALLLLGLSILLFALVFTIVGRSYRQINSALQSHGVKRTYRVTALKRRSPLWSIAFKEYRRLVSSTAYMVNGALGEILSALVGLATLLIGFDRIVSIVTQGAPMDASILQPAIPFIVYFFIGMVATTACSPSLEGKNYWIVQSLPLEKKTLYQGKMLFNMLLTLPFMGFSTLCLCISAGVPWLNTVLYLLLGFVLCCFSTAWGCVCGIRHLRLDWENEIEVIKQGSAVAIYMLPNMFAVMGLTVLSVILGLHMDHRLLTLLFILAASLLAYLAYRRVMTLAKREDNHE